MSFIEKIKIISGVYWIGIPEADLYILCGCPEDSVKHLMKMGLIKTTEENNVVFETGPNTILLSDNLVQNGYFSNLSEFPVLQMLYRQGMILPNHPNNTGRKPLLIGSEKQVKAQMEYIYCGNYGLSTVEEIVKTGVSEDQANEMIRLKLKFSFGKIRETKELLDSCILKEEPMEIAKGVMLIRTGINKFEFNYAGESVSIDLNLNSNETYKPPYVLGYHHIRKEYFAVVHSGGGDGWDINRPCMSSILMFQGKLYLIDAGPNILNTLTALGISANEIEGIFHTHCHDDHFAGLTTLIHSDHKLKYYATPLVRASVSKKLNALMSSEEDCLDRYFDIHDLTFDLWNNIAGLEVKPTFSPHPVETNIYTFRVIWENGYCTYSHFADIVSLDILKEMINDDISKPGITEDFFNLVRSKYLEYAMVKKIDIGGGLIHGDANDFKDDTSGKIILSHNPLDLNNYQKEIGSKAPFGLIDVIIPANDERILNNAYHYLYNYIPSTPNEDIQVLLNCHVVPFNAGSILLKQGERNSDIYLLLAGTVEMINADIGMNHLLTAGSMIGEYSTLEDCVMTETYSARSYGLALKIPNSLYLEIVRRNNLFVKIKNVHKKQMFLQNTPLFGEMVSYPVQNKIAQTMIEKSYKKGEIISIPQNPELLILKNGKVEISGKERVLETIEDGDFFREYTILHEDMNIFTFKIIEPSEVYHIPGYILRDIPVVQWKLLETNKKRIKAYFDNEAKLTGEV
ncbi:MAG: cyclic nucleotide-binding domain-containing protein [Spirochaetaceae bacterium]